MTINKSKEVALADGVALTGASAVLGDPFDVRNNSDVSLIIEYTKGGSATALILAIEGTLTKGSWTHAVEIPIALDTSGAISSGVGTATLGRMRYSVDTSGNYHIALKVGAAHQIRVKGHETGTAGGTISIRAAGVEEGR